MWRIRANIGNRLSNVWRIRSYLSQVKCKWGIRSSFHTIHAVLNRIFHMSCLSHMWRIWSYSSHVHILHIAIFFTWPYSSWPYSSHGHILHMCDEHEMWKTRFNTACTTVKRKLFHYHRTKTECWYKWNVSWLCSCGCNTIVTRRNGPTCKTYIHMHSERKGHSSISVTATLVTSLWDDLPVLLVLLLFVIVVV